MAIFINHRFSSRLLPDNDIDTVKVLVIGTFNPGEPDLKLLSTSELLEFEQIRTRPKFQRFSQVRNFYDRPQNRFWKVMDSVANPDFYKSRSLNSKNLGGLKYYAGLEREKVFGRQLNFCRSQGLFITDIVKAIRPKAFSGIYDNFQDTDVEQAAPVWNDGILKILEKYKPEKVIINFDRRSKAIPNIGSKVDELMGGFPADRIVPLPSTSGAAGNTYAKLCDVWGKALSCLTACS